MPIRIATSADHASMARVAAKAFTNDSLFGDFLHPYRHAHPEDYICSWERMLWVKTLEPAREYLVSVDEETGEIAAWAGWVRLGPGAAKRPTSLSARLSWIYRSSLDRVYEIIWPDKSADPVKIAAFYSSHPLCAHLWSGQREDGWMLDLLCTDPAFEGKGHGKGLVKWGLEKSKEEGVCSSVIAAEGKDGFYEKFGFREVGRANVGAISSISGGAVMFIDV